MPKNNEQTLLFSLENKKGADIKKPLSEEAPPPEESEQIPPKGTLEYFKYRDKKFENLKAGDPCPMCGESKLVIQASAGGIFLTCKKYPDEHYRFATDAEKKAWAKSRKGERQPGEFGRD